MMGEGGLLDFVKTPEGQGLLSAVFGGLAGAGRGAPINSLGRAGMAGLSGYAAAQDRVMQEAQAKQMNEYRGMQMADLREQTAGRQAALDVAKRKQAALPTLFGGSTIGGEVQTPEAGGMPMFSQGSTITPKQNVGGGRVNYLQALQAGYSPAEIEALAKLPDAGRAEVARTMKGMGADGREVEYQFDKFGQKVGEGMAQYRAPIEMGQGDRKSLLDPYTLRPKATFAINQSPDSAASNAVTMRGQNMTDARARETINQGKTQLVNDPERGPMLVNMGTGAAMPVRGQDGQPVASANSTKQTTGSKKALDIVSEAEKLIDGATGSYAGAGADVLAAGVGIGTKGAQSIAKLKALEGSLMMAQPRMEGPQSDKDVSLYRQMAAQLGDSTVPNSVKKAALETVKGLHQKYAGTPAAGGASGGWSMQRAD